MLWGQERVCVEREDQEHWRGESLKPRLAFVPGAVSTGCLDRLMAQASGALRGHVPGAVWV